MRGLADKSSTEDFLKPLYMLVPEYANSPDDWLLDGVSRPLPAADGEKEPEQRRSVTGFGSYLVSTIVNRPAKIDAPAPAAPDKIELLSTREILSILFTRAKIGIRTLRSNIFRRLKKSTDRIHRIIPKNLRKYGKEQIILAFAGVAVFIIGITVSLLSFNTNSQVMGQNDQNRSAAISGDNPSEDPPSDSGTYQVPSDHPKRITINKLSVSALIRPLGTKDNNELLAPSNIYDAGWYEKSSKPGELGAMLIDGHVSGPTKPGIFKNLKNLAVGDMITVERGDGAKFDYIVEKTQTYDADKVDMLAAMLPVKPGNPGLNLISCTGQFNPKDRTYKQRVVVFASQINQ